MSFPAGTVVRLPCGLMGIAEGAVEGTSEWVLTQHDTCRLVERRDLTQVHDNEIFSWFKVGGIYKTKIGSELLIASYEDGLYTCRYRIAGGTWRDCERRISTEHLNELARNYSLVEEIFN